MIGISSVFAGAPGGVQRLDGAAVFSAQIVEIRDVVVRLRDEQRHIVLLAERTRSLIRRERTRKIVETDQADGHVAEEYSESLGVLVRHQTCIGALVVRDRFLEAVLTVIDIADIDFEPGQTPGIVQAFKYLAGAFRRLKRLIVFTQ